MRVNSARTSLIVTWAALSLLVGKPSRADLSTADTAYQKGDFKTAFQQFKDLAELGQPTAQFNLAVMYARGQGVMQNFTLAESWAAIATASGAPGAQKLADMLRPQLTPNSLQFSAQMQAEYGQSALAARLFPRLLKGRDYADRSPAARLKAYVPEYPMRALMSGVNGDVYVEFIIAPDGHARIPHVLFALPQGYFDESVIDSVMRSTYLPARIDERPVATSTTTLYNFKVTGTTIDDYSDLAARVRETAKKAKAGDPNAQMLYGMMLAGLPQLKKTYDQALPWFLKAAQAGAPYAQYQVGIGLMEGHGCQCEPAKGALWLEKAAQADQPDAQVALADYLLRDHHDNQSIAAAKLWLERAVKQGNVYGKLRLSAILASSPSADLRDPPRALVLAGEARHQYRNDPSLWEIMAAADASEGHFKAAVGAETRALGLAKRYGWDLSALQQRESSYESDKPWTGNVLDF